MHLLDEDFNAELIILLTVAVIFVVFLSRGGSGDRNPDSCVPHGLVLVFLCSVWRAILLPVAGHDDVALRELGQRLAGQLSLQDGQLEGTLLPLDLYFVQVSVTRRLLCNLLLRLYHILLLKKL